MIILVVVVGITQLVLREKPSEEEGAYHIGTMEGDAIEPDLSFAQIIRRRNFWIVIAVFIPVAMPSSALTANLAPLVTSLGLTTSEAALLIGLFSAAAALGKLATGDLSDRFGNRLPLILTAVLTAGATFSIAFAHGFLGCFWGHGPRSDQRQLGIDGAMQRRGVRVGQLSACAGSGQLFGVVASLVSPILALMNETTGSYMLGILLLAAFGLLAIVASFYRPRRSALA